MKIKKFGLIETKLVHFHRIFKNGWWGQGGGFERIPGPPVGSATELLCFEVAFTVAGNVLVIASEKYC